MNHKLIILAALILALPAYAQADAPDKDAKAAPIKDDCLMENANLNVTTKVESDSFNGAKSELNKTIKQITDLAKEKHVKEFALENIRYNFHTEHAVKDSDSKAVYLLEGGVDYHLSTSEEAFKFAELLTQKDFHVSVGVHQPCEKTLTP